MSDQEREELAELLTSAAALGWTAKYRNAFERAAADLRRLSAPVEGEAADEVRGVMISAGIDPEFTPENVRTLVHYYQTEMHKLRVANAAPVEGEAAERIQWCEETRAAMDGFIAAFVEAFPKNPQARAAAAEWTGRTGFEKTAALIRRLERQCLGLAEAVMMWQRKESEACNDAERLQRALDEADEAEFFDDGFDWSEHPGYTPTPEQAYVLGWGDAVEEIKLVKGE